jgi:hypothetical protein
MSMALSTPVLGEQLVHGHSAEGEERDRAPEKGDHQSWLLIAPVLPRSCFVRPRFAGYEGRSDRGRSCLMPA